MLEAMSDCLKGYVGYRRVIASDRDFARDRRNGAAIREDRLQKFGAHDVPRAEQCECHARSRAFHAFAPEKARQGRQKDSSVFGASGVDDVIVTRL